MRFKNILSAILTSAVLFSGCAKEESTESLKSIQVSQTYLSIAPAGSSAEVTVNSTVAWNIKSTLPDWLTVSATSGNAGQSKLVFTAPACDYGRQAEIQIAAGAHTQFLTVRQGEMTVETVQCKDVLSGTDGKTYRVTGICTSIANTQYGNWYINDGTGEVYVYGTVDAGGSYNWASFNIEVGDVVTIEGPKTTYGTTVELVDATFISVTKSLLKLYPENVSVPAAGGEFTVKAAYKGNGTFVNIPDDAAAWLSLKSMDYKAGIPTKLEKAPADTAVITFCALSNVGGPRSADIEISTKTSSNNSSLTLAVTQLGLSGTETTPFTVDEAIEFCKSLTTATTDKYWIKGKVSKIIDSYTEKYGNATFWISGDGQFYDDKAKDFEVYQAYYLDNQKWVGSDRQVQVGDEVVVCGQLTKYGETCETNKQKAYVVSFNGVKDKMLGDGTAENPFNVAAAICFCNTLTGATTEDYYVQGVVSKLVSGGFDPKYGNGTFWISEDGAYNDNLFKDFEVYRTMYLGNRKFVEGDANVAVGDKVVICGQLTNYKGTSETNQNKSYLVSVN